MTERSHPNWFKSTYSGGSGTECVEAAFVPGGLLVRDSKRPSGPHLELSPNAWTRFIGNVVHRAAPGHFG
ncbi:DUF397 domain-containing protein [Streptomyces griseoflavus]|uniref:DUF397 domain-containing protein n=1 Tax=Streptomyces griseoflavus TaxID=35619 RepID=UPI0033D83BE4